MRLYLAPEASLALIRYLRSINGSAGLEGSTTRKRPLNDAINTVHGLQQLDHTAQLWLEHAKDENGRIHAYVASRAKGTSTKHLVTHVLGNDAPHGAFLDIGHGICICSPRFAFMQLMASHDIVDSVRTGMELCGYYSKWELEPTTPNAAYATNRREGNGCTFELPPALHITRAQEFVNRHPGLRGSRGANTVLRWVIDGSASPMETAVYLLLCLPKRLGGYGLPKPLLNPKVIISNPDGVKERYPDLFWRGANIDVEYNSDAEHSGEWSRYRDSKREIELTIASIKVLPLTRPQLMSGDEFDTFAQGLRRMLGIRARPIDPAWLAKRDDLRATLLREWQ